MSATNLRFVAVCLTVSLTLAAIMFGASHAGHVTAATENEKMPNLQGDKAKEYLQKQNSYASLQEAMKAARYQVNLEATPFAELPAALHAANPAQNFSAYFTSTGMLLALRDETATKTDESLSQGRQTPVKRLEMRLEAIG